jgi:hypothetical protein
MLLLGESAREILCSRLQIAYDQQLFDQTSLDRLGLKVGIRIKFGDEAEKVEAESVQGLIKCRARCRSEANIDGSGLAERFTHNLLEYRDDSELD